MAFSAILLQFWAKLYRFESAAGIEPADHSLIGDVFTPLEIVDRVDMLAFFRDNGLQLAQDPCIVHETTEHFVKKDGVLFKFDRSVQKLGQQLHAGDFIWIQRKGLVLNAAQQQLATHFEKRLILSGNIGERHHFGEPLRMVFFLVGHPHKRLRDFGVFSVF